MFDTWCRRCCQDCVRRTLQWCYWRWVWNFTCKLYKMYIYVLLQSSVSGSLDCITVLWSCITYSDLCLQWRASQHCHLDKKWCSHFLLTLSTSTEFGGWRDFHLPQPPDCNKWRCWETTLGPSAAQSATAEEDLQSPWTSMVCSLNVTAWYEWLLLATSMNTYHM